MYKIIFESDRSQKKEIYSLLQQHKTEKMKVISLAITALSVFASLASAGVVITKITREQVIEKNADDCFFGVTTPQGCG